MSLDPRMWEVLEWCHVEHLEDLFADQGIDFDAFMTLEREDFRNLGISIGALAKLLNLQHSLAARKVTLGVPNVRPTAARYPNVQFRYPGPQPLGIHPQSVFVPQGEAPTAVLVAQLLAAERRVVENAAEAQRLVTERDRLAAALTQRADVAMTMANVKMMETASLVGERNRLAAQVKHWEQALRPTDEALHEMESQDIEELLAHMRRAIAEVEAIQVEQLNCVVCLEQQKAVVFLPCQHRCSCGSCAGRLAACPVCGAPIRQRTNVLGVLPLPHPCADSEDSLPSQGENSSPPATWQPSG